LTFFPESFNHSYRIHRITICEDRPYDQHISVGQDDRVSGNQEVVRNVMSSIVSISKSDRVEIFEKKVLSGIIECK